MPITTPRRLTLGAGLCVVALAAAFLATRPEDVPVRVGTTDSSSAGAAENAAGGDVAMSFSRITPEGVQLDATIGQGWLGPGSYQLPECVDPLTIELSASSSFGEDVIGMPLPEPGPDEVAVTPISPGAGVSALGIYGADVIGVVARSTDGRTDEAEAVDGFAVAALSSLVPGSDQMPVYSWMDTATVRLTEGRTVDISITALAGANLVGIDGVPRESPADVRMRTGACSTGAAPLLPEPGAAQPDAEADASVREVITTVGDGTLAIEDRVALTTRPGTATAAFNELPEPLRAQGSGLKAEIVDLVFTDDTTAIAIVNVLVLDKPLVTNGYVKVVKQDGRWLVTWESVCRFTSGYAPEACADAPADYPPEARRRAGGE